MDIEEIPVESAVGLPLAYDITEIVPGERQTVLLR